MGVPPRSHRWPAFQIALILGLAHDFLSQIKLTGVRSGAGAIVMHRRKRMVDVFSD